MKCKSFIAITDYIPTLSYFKITPSLAVSNMIYSIMYVAKIKSCIPRAW